MTIKHTAGGTRYEQHGVPRHERVGPVRTWQDQEAGCGPWFAAQHCSCGQTITGRCCSPSSAVQWLRTEQHHHETADRHSFEVVA
jgi:hypothetical protein